MKTGVFNLKLSKLKLYNYRCFGDVEQVIDINNITAFIGNNSTGKTAALLALNCCGENSASPFFQSLVVDEPKGRPYLRIRLEATWEKSNNTEGAIESKIYYITCPEKEEIREENKTKADRRDLDRVRVIYVPAVRDPSKQLKNVSGTMTYQIMNNINWSDITKINIKGKIDELNAQFLEEKGVSILGTSIHTQWKNYDSGNYRFDIREHQQTHNEINEFFDLLKTPGMATIIG